MVYGQYTIYPTINSTFQYPLDKVFENKGFFYDILDSQSPFTIQQAIVQGSTQDLPQIGNLIYTSQSLDNYFAALSYQSDFFMASIFQVGHSGELKLSLIYTVNASLYTCYNLVLYKNDSVVINCIQHKTNFVTLLQFGSVSAINTTNITIKPEQVQSSVIFIQRNAITFSYQFENYIDMFYTYYNSIFILQMQKHQILNGQYLKIYQNQEEVVIALKNDSIIIYHGYVTVINARRNMTFIDFEVQSFSYDWQIITIYLLSSNSIDSLHVYPNGTYKYYSKAAFKQEYNKIFISQNSILLNGDKQLAYYKIDANGYISYYNYLNKNNKCQNLVYIWVAQLLYCIDSQQYTPYQQGAPYLYSKNGVHKKGTIKLQTTDIDGFTDIVSVKYYPLQPNEQGIYNQFENQEKQYIYEGGREFTYLDLSQTIVGSNLSYHYDGIDQQMKQAFILDTYKYGVRQSTLCSIMFSSFSYAWVQACFKDGELTVDILSSQFYNVNETVYTQKVLLLTEIMQVEILPSNVKNQRRIKIILVSSNRIYIYNFLEFVSLNLQSTVYMTIQNKDILIQNIQTLNGIIVILTQNPNRVFFASMQLSQIVPIQMQLDYSREVLQIATNIQSYNFLIINQAGQAQIVRFQSGAWVYSYEIIKTINYPDGYLKSILGPVQQGIFFYFYTNTKSELYFLQKEFIKQIDLQNNLFFTKVDTSRYKIQQKLTYSYSNKFFYVVCQDNSENQLLNIYKGSYQGIKLLRKSILSQIVQIASNVYQDESKQYGSDLILIYSGNGFNFRLLVSHKAYLINLPEFSWKLSYQMKVTFTVNNNFTQTQVQSTLLVNQSYLQLTSQPKNLLGQTFKIKNNKFSFEVSKMFNGPITNYSLLCDGCEIQQFQLPIEDKLETFKLDYDSYVLKEDILFLNQKEGSLYSIDLKKKSGIELLIQGYISNCSHLFLERNTNNPSWACQTGTQIIFFTYNPSTKQTQQQSIEFEGMVYDYTYTFGYLQILNMINGNYECSFYSIIQYNIDKEIHVNILIKQQPLDTVIKTTKPIVLDNSISNPIIGLIGVNSKQVQFFIIANIAINKTQVSVYPYPLSSFNTQNTQTYQAFQLGKPQKRDNYIFIQLYQSGFLTPQLFEIKFNLDGSYQEQQSICHFNQLIHSQDYYNNYAATSNGKKLIILQNNIDTFLIEQQSELLIYDLELCGKIKLVNPYQQLKLILFIDNYSTIEYLNNDTLTYITQGELSILKSTGQLTGTYKETEEDSTVSVIALNPVSQATQGFAISQKQNQSTSEGLAWYWIVLIVMSSLVAAFFGYVFIRKKVFRRNVPINQEDYYFKMR